MLPCWQPLFRLRGVQLQAPPTQLLPGLSRGLELARLLLLVQPRL